MNVPRILPILLLLFFTCSSSLKNDRGGSSPGNGPNFVRRNRRIALHEYLVPPPPPRHHPVRSGRVANPQPTEAPGYFSKFIDWLSPFGFGASSPPPLSPPSYLESSFPLQAHLLPLNAHPPAQPGPALYPSAQPGPALYPSAQPGPALYPSAQPGPALHPPVGAQPPLPIYPPLGQPPSQHSGLLLAPSLASHPVPSLNAPPGPSLPIYGAPPPTLHEAKQLLPPPKGSQAAYPSTSKGRPCNPCNKLPWIPMQNAGSLPDLQFPLPPQLSNRYLPPANPAVHDIQHAASHEIRIPDFSYVQIEQTGQGLVSPLPHPLLYPGPMPPLYKAAPFDRPQNPHKDSLQHLEPPSLPSAPSLDQEHKNPDVNDERFNIRDSHDLTSSGTQVDQGHVSVASQDYKGSFGTSVVENEPSAPESFPEREYHDASVPKQGGLHHSGESNQNAVTSFGPSSVENHSITGQSGDVYQESFPSSAQGSGLNYLPPDLNPSASFGASTFNNQGAESLSYQYSDDLSSSSSVVKDSHETTLTSALKDSHAAPTSSPSGEQSIHFEQSPLLDLTKGGEGPAASQWLSPTTALEEADSTLESVVNDNLRTDSTAFGDSSSFAKPTEPYFLPNVQNVDVFPPSTPASFELSEGNDNRYGGTSTINAPYNQQGVSYVPPSGQPGYLWPSLQLNAPISKNETSSGDAFVDPLARWNASSEERKSYEQQGSTDPTNNLRQQSVKRNKQVQVIIPYTSEYTPIPFQQSYGDWSTKNNFERSQARKIPPSSNTNIDNYLQQESRNEIRLINQLHSQYNFNDSRKLNIQSARPSLTTTENDSRSTTLKVNNSIDVRRLQKNIDNWTIQEYSKPTTSSTILPSSPHPYLLPSKKIPTEYLTTTESSNHANEPNNNIESVKTYSLAGFSFNEVDHEGSASNRIEATQTPPKVIRPDSSKLVSDNSESAKKSPTKEKSTWEGYSVSISPIDKERVYVVTPQPIPTTTPRNDFARDNVQQTNKSVAKDEESRENIDEFEAIEKAYQVLPQAVNNLAVASTGKEEIPLWGIMEHDEFASLNLDEGDDEAGEDVADGPILYAGHSKVSRAKR